MTPAARADRIRAGDLRAAARLIRDIEDELAHPSARATDVEATLRALYPHSGAAFVLGITGPPGAGKSTLVDALVTRLRARGDQVGVVAVDPSSPFTGGAILGDRIRMQRHALDEGVFIRSLATRGQMGGLCRAAADVVTVMAARGAAVVIVETVGVGQDEVDIAGLADVVAVALVPGLGDDVQAIKAGVLEIADLFVVNKADRAGADHVVSDLQAMLSLRPADPIGDRLVPAIVKTAAAQDQGIAELLAAIEGRRDVLARGGAGELRRQRQAQVRLQALLQDRIRRRVETQLGAGVGLAAVAREVAARRLDPYAAVDGLLRTVGSAPA
ncbi:MAG TPA: methylmalonyl Co-A mutase-associated GTPase MeaB [Polyangia bacterium]